MERAWWKILIGFLWTAPLLMFLRYRMVWDRLPERMATHFDAAGRANGWMSRETSLHFTLGFLGFTLAIFTVVLFLVQRKPPISLLSWSLLAFFHLETWGLLWMLNSMVDYNLSGHPLVVAPLMIVTPIGVLALVAIAFTEKRGSAFPGTEVIAEEVHAGKAWSVLFLLPLAGTVFALVVVPAASMRLGAVLISLVLIGVWGMAWDGFHYFFSRSGIEVRTMGLRLKSVPTDHIKDYSVQEWKAFGGYGVRGIGHNKAYVWGNRGVRVRTAEGEIFLGHNEPERIMHDLETICRPPTASPKAPPAGTETFRQHRQ